MNKLWFRTPQQQPQADTSEMETLKIGEEEIEVSKSVAETLRNQGRTQATQAFIAKAVKVKPEDMDIGDKTKPGKILDQVFGMVQSQAATIAEYEAKAKDKKPAPEPEELKQAKLDLATKANELEQAKAELYKNFARDQAVSNVLSSAKRDFSLTEESEGLYLGMIENVFDFEVDTDGNEGFLVTFSKKGEGFPFMVDSKPATSKQLADLIAKAYPGNHGNGVQPGLSSRRTAQPGVGSTKPLAEQSTREIENRAWGS